MSELKTAVTNNELRDIRSPNVLYIMRTIKAIQNRMKDPDISGLEYIRVYDTLGKEFPEFFDKYTHIFTKVIRGENLNTVASVLYYKDKVERGLMTEAQLSDMLANKFLPSHLKQESDAKIKEMKERGDI
jgi:phenylalanine-4-hydroxylase